ncbi:MAG: TraR/DksA family transcriptional regulator [Alphaproteobacteria bacterium]|nr:TraR/DksA family transcriptional regulator [Alphaproteobacteria bacterium]
MAKTNYKQQLQDDKIALQNLITLAGDESNAVELDQSKLGRLSRMDALQKQAMSQEVNRRRQIELTRINAALLRIEEDEFGYCITCGEEIELQRLALNPSLPQCGKCAAG